MIAQQDSIETTDDRCPGERDMQIYGAVRVDGRRQVDVAAEFGVTQGRVSQIVRKVHRWRLGMGIAAELERRDRRSVEQWLEQLRIDKLYEETMELYRRSKEPRRKERRGKDHRGEWSSESLDHQPGNLQCLKFAGRLIELRRQLDADPPPPNPSGDVTQSRLHDFEAVQRLEQMRDDAIRRGDVPAGGVTPYVVRALVDQLLGRKPHISPGEREAEEARTAEVNAAAACLMDEPKTAGWAVPTTGRYDEEEMGTAHPTNEAAIISDISAAAAGDEATNIDATDCPEATSGNAPAANSPAAGANIREIFSQVPVAYGGAEETMTGKLATGRWAERMEPAAWGVR
jgi:hypothetical protein